MRARAERERRARRQHRPNAASGLPSLWRPWLGVVSPHLTAFGTRHTAFWDHVEAIQPKVRPRPYIAPWPRKGGKTTTGENAVGYLAEQRKRSFCLYVCGTQDNANDRVAGIETIFGRIGGPLAEVATNTLGHSRGWKTNRKQTASGFVLLGIGLDTVMRGAKVDDLVPDLILLDDIDGRHDTVATTAKKIQLLSETILPAGTPECAVFMLQNLIIPNGVCARLVDGRADFLLDRVVSGPYKAIEGIQTERRWSDELQRELPYITGGTPTWDGQGIEACQNYIITYGWRAFDREMQHNVRDVEGALWTTEVLNETRVSKAECPSFSRVVVAVDPPATSKNSSNEAGIVGMGRTAAAHGYIVADESGTMSPSQWGRTAVRLHDQLAADSIVIEGNQGGEMARDVVLNAAKALFDEGERSSAYVLVKMVHASKGKRARAEPVAQAFDEKRMHMVGEHPDLEEQMTTWNAADGGDSPDRLDAMVWATTELGLVNDHNDAEVILL
ncbi:MAG: hypothetical protein RhofKO_25780 [Rhodothermales bacterium]